MTMGKGALQTICFLVADYLQAAIMYMILLMLRHIPPGDLHRYSLI